MFCTGAAPTVPGIPDRGANPAHWLAMASRTRSSQVVPAVAVTSTPPHTESETSETSARASRMTRPSKPASEAMMLEPPPMTRTGVPAASASRIASVSSLWVVAST